MQQKNNYPKNLLKKTKIPLNKMRVMLNDDYQKNFPVAQLKINYNLFFD